jgi:glycosyltransferase involved in cell wall biosynthesis
MGGINKIVKHSIISWDCSFRNFYHLIDGLLAQKYDRDKFEFIYVEQRSREVADAFNHKLGLKSLWDRYQEVKNSINLRVIYLNDPLNIPYHVGRAVNKGIEEAKGEIISVMDGDLLVPPDFLVKLERYHRKQGTAIVNLMRHTCSRPVGVDKAHWTKQIIDFERCLEVCPTRNDPIPRKVENKGPLISARREFWEAIGGYDIHPIWSTGVSRIGQDVTARLEIFTGVQSTTLPKCLAVHPWHPQGFLRETISSQRMLSLHSELIDWAHSYRQPSWKKRLSYTEQLYLKNKKFVDKMIYSDLKQPGNQNIDPTSLKMRCSILIGKASNMLAQVRQKFRL